MSSGRRPATRKTRGPGRSCERKTARPEARALERRARAPPRRARHGDVDLGDRPARGGGRAAAPPTIQACRPRRAATCASDDELDPPAQSLEFPRRLSDPADHGPPVADARARPAKTPYNFEDVIRLAPLSPSRSSARSPTWRACACPTRTCRAGPSSSPASSPTSTSSPTIPEAAFGAARAGAGHARRGRTRRSPGGGREALEANAPRLVHGYGVVPRVVGGRAREPA